jgi:hypothetical protein
MKKLFALLALAVSLAVPAAELAGVKVDDTVKVGGKDLQLNGMGVRIKYMVAKVYVGAFYAPQKLRDGDAVLNSREPRRMALTMLRKVESEDLHKSLIEGMQNNSSPAEMKALEGRMNEMAQNIRSVPLVDKGDIVVLDFLPGKGVQISVKGQVKDVIQGDDFARALLAIWFGKKPIQEDLKAKLLGG